MKINILHSIIVNFHGPVQSIYYVEYIFYISIFESVKSVKIKNPEFKGIS